MNDAVTQADTPNRTQRRASKTRVRLLKAALSAFAEAGTDAVTGFVSGFLSFAMITMKPEAVRKSIEPLRDAFLGGVISYMEQP